ncbi:hypothetical protein DFH09DRAFT_1182058 [Mycena vulgaris]|nr:hypothetical protein DFH09DRAFT_1182058 [Mycena vulgaris]
MTILLTGGTGKSATPLAKLLLQANHPVILATRSGKVPAPFKGARFDWFDAATYPLLFEMDPSITRIYLIAPGNLDIFTPMKAFIDFAVTKGVKRFVLMSGIAMGKVHQYLSTLNVEYFVLRPSWFFDNFLLQYGDRIRTKSEIVSAAGDELVGYVSTEDIAEVAFKALVDDVVENTESIIVGPELLSYDKIAGILTEILGREIKHTRLTEADFEQALIRRGLREDYAQMLAALDTLISQGSEEKVYSAANVIGKRTIRAFFEANKDVWRAAD